MKKIILASQSPRRKQLLEQAEIAFEICVAHTNEEYPDSLAAEKVPEFIAKEKAAAVWSVLEETQKQDCVVVAADTVVILDGQIIGKPRDEAEAKAILKRLGGRTHKVVTGVAVRSQDKETGFGETTEVHFNPLTDSQIEHYVAQYKPFDKAGAYAIQEWIGVVGIKKIDGDFYNVMGLPVSKLLPYIT
ncbi:MAG: Maf family protein [Edaphocola sp.]